MTKKIISKRKCGEEEKNGELYFKFSIDKLSDFFYFSEKRINLKV